MKHDVLQQASVYTEARQRRKRWKRVVTCLAAVVVLCTVYVLILPAITLENGKCTIPEHTHDLSCYKQETSLIRTEPVCTVESLMIHQHTADCYGENGEAVCGYADFVVHEHDASCYDEQGDLWCPLTEIKAHTHGEDCFAAALTEENPGHVHTDACYTMQKGELICTEAVEEGHSHSESCYAETVSLLCDTPESIGHQHGADCFDESGTLICALQESDGHQHDESCYGTVTELICQLPEVSGHQHTDACYEWEQVLTCDLPAEEEKEPDSEDSAEAELLCEQKEIILHEHDDGCFDENGQLICGKTEVWEHIHDENCFQTVEETVDMEALTCPLSDSEAHIHGEVCYDENGQLICKVEEGSVHQHTALCYGTWELTCTLQEHSHSAGCQMLPTLTEEEQARVDEVTALIDGLPTTEEIEAKLNAYEDAGDDEGYEAYYAEVRAQIVPVYINYQAMDPRLQELVLNRDKLFALEWLWSSVTYAMTDTVNVTAVNAHSYSATIIYHNDSGMSVGDNTSGEKNYAYWTAVHVEYENGRYVVKEILNADGTSKRAMWASGNGFILLFHEKNINADVNVNVGDEAVVSSDFWKTYHQYNGTVWGSVKFQTAAAQKNEKNNSDQLHIVGAASTRDFIELNLYDYGSGSTGKNINDKFNSDKKMPGFQQSGGTKNIASLDEFKSTSYMNFGDIVTDDLADGTLVTVASENPQGINVVKDTANSPISKYSNVMSRDLKDGYPALADGTSLAYLFDGKGYSKKMNSESIDGLFQYNETTGAYSFNSRENFAQFNSGPDTFTLYDEIFTPNFIMYPFGNFMPFNDIVYDSKQVSQINEDYFNELYLQANYLYQQGKGDQYAQLAKVLGQFMDYAKQDNWGDDWTAKRALEHYFYWGSELPKDDDNNYNQISLDRLYSLDYDVESDFFFGMEMKMNFMQPKSGLTGKDGQQPMVFYFTGDDDVWVYIDGKLFLDLSGIHRHVGGKIDFVNGRVEYYSLNTMTGDVDSTPYKTVKFSELVADQSMLNERGTFKDYSTHEFRFYYMERGSGSSVCRMNFNFPLLRQNSISVTKELSVDEEDKLDLLGNPDFRFQIRKENSDDLFIGGGVSYDILDTAGNELGRGITDEYGTFTLKANQTAVFRDINENSGKYFVRELLDPDAFQQYGDITVDGSSVTTGTDSDVIVGSDTFIGVDSPVKDVSDGSTVFHFNNQVTFKKLGKLEITKKLETYPNTRSTLSFDFQVTLDGTKLPVGTVYTVGNESRTVSSEGIITLAPDETAVISNILAESTYMVEELSASAQGYYVTYSIDGTVTNGDYACGTIKTETSVSVIVTNGEQGVTVAIPVQKQLNNPDGGDHNFQFRLEQVTDSTGANVTENGTVQTADITVTGGAASNFQFQLTYLERDISTPATFYYKITEVKGDSAQVQYDEAVYIAEILVSKTDAGLSAAIQALWKDGKELETTDSPLSFTNVLLSNLTVSKQVKGNVSVDTSFGFTLCLKTGEIPLKGSYNAEKTTGEGSPESLSVTFDSDGKTEIQLKHGEKLKILGIPAGSTWSVIENNAEAYQVSYQVDSGESTEGSQASGTLSGTGSEVMFINSAGYELPETGGSGTNRYIMGGLLLTGAALLLLYKHTKRGKEDFFSL